MNRRILYSSLLIVTAVTLLAILAFRVRIGATADSVAVMQTAGMTCSSCSKTITAALEREKGVAVTEVDLAGGWVIVGYDKKSVKPEALAQKVSDTGYRSNLYAVLTPAEFKRITGREIGKIATSSKGCCSGKTGGCGANTQNQAKGE